MKKAIVGALSAVIALAAGAQNPGAHDPPYPAPGKLVDLGGWRLHLHCTGSPAVNQPTVVLEAGLGAMAVDWALVQPLVAKDARVCSYRAGTGWSDLGPNPRTMRQIVAELHALLEKSGERVPVVMVGHSFGGALVRLYAATYPATVAGIVLVDAQADDYVRLTANGEVMASTLASGRAIPPVKMSGPLRESDIPSRALQQIQSMSGWNAAHANDPPRDRLPSDAQRLRVWATAQVKHGAASNNPFEGDELLAMQAARKASPHPLGDIPLIVLTRAGRVGADSASQGELATRSTRGRQRIVAGTGHHIDIERPEVVADAIREVLRMIAGR